MRDSSGFADYLRTAMRAVGMDPDQRGAAAELARKADISETQVNRWLNKGHQPSIDNLRKIAPVLRVRMVDLLVQAGHISAGELATTEVTAETAILQASDLSERDRRMLLTMLAQMRERTGYREPASNDQRTPSDGEDPGEEVQQWHGTG